MYLARKWQHALRPRAGFKSLADPPAREIFWKLGMFAFTGPIQWFASRQHATARGGRYVGQICDAFSAQERAAKIAELAQRVVALQAGRDAEIKSLRAEVERLQNELAKVKK